MLQKTQTGSANNKTFLHQQIMKKQRVGIQKHILCERILNQHFFFFAVKKLDFT